MQFTTPIQADEFVNIPWLYKKEMENGIAYSFVGAGGFLLLRFLPNHRIEILSGFKIDDVSQTYQWWNYDKNDNKIILYDGNFEKLMVCNLPRVLPDESKRMHVNDGNPNGETYLQADVSEQVIDTQQLGGSQVSFLMPHNEWKLHRSGEHFSKLAKYNFNVYEIKKHSLDIEVLIEMQKYLAENSSIKRIIFMSNPSYLTDERHLKLEEFDGNLHIDGIDFISAHRALFLEYLDTLIIQAYKRMYLDQHVDLDELSQEILDKYFVDRYKKI